MGRRNRLSNEEIEGLLEGRSEDAELSDLQRVLEELRAATANTIDERLVARYVDESVTASLRPGRSRHLPARGLHRLVGRRAAIGSVAALVLLIGMSGVAWAANSSKPGDSFYGLDRAFEAIGIGNGGPEERLSEIRALFVAGDLTRMLDHVANVIPADSEGTVDATRALREAAASMRGAATTSTETITNVSALLSYLTNNLDGLDAAEITDIAGHIRTRGFEAPDAGLTPADPTDPSGFKEKDPTAP